MKIIRINFWIFLIIVINFTFIIFYTSGNYNYLWGYPNLIITYNPEKAFRTFLYTWDDTYNLGGTKIFFQAYLLILPLFIILHNILDLKSIYFFYKFLIVIIAGVSMFYFSKLIIKDFKNRQIFSFISAFIYMFNPQTARWISGNIDLMIPYALTPAILYFLVKTISERKILNIFFVAVFLSITFLFNIGSIFVMLTLILLFIFSYSLLTKEYRFIKNTLIALSISLLLISWHILPAAYHFLNNIGAWKSVGAMERFYSIRANTINTLELTNAWEMFAVYHGYKIYYFSDIYKNFEVLLLLMPIITFVPLLFLQKLRESKHLAIILSFICIVGIILAQGTNPSSLFSQFYRFLLENVPIFNAVRNSTKFNHLIVFSYSLLFPYSIFILYKIFNKQKKNLNYIGKISVMLLLVIGLSIYSAPFWSGKLFNNYTTGIPKEVFLVSKYINQEKEDGAVLILPGPWLSTYKWLHPYISRPIYLSTIKENPIIFRYGGSIPLNVYARDFLETFYKNLFSFQDTQILRILKLLRVKYILIDGTVDVNFYRNNTFPSANITHIKQFIESLNSIRFVANFGKIYLYKCNNVSPIFFIPSAYVYMLNITPDIFYWSSYYDPLKVVPVKEYKVANFVISLPNVDIGVNNLQNKTVIYLFEAESDLYRSDAKVIKNSKASNGELIILGKNGKAWQDLEIVKNGTYRIALRGIGEFEVNIGDKSFILKSNKLNFTYSPPFYLTKGKYRLEIIPMNVKNLAKPELDVVWLYSSNKTIDQLFKVKEKPAKVISYEKINPTLWKVKVNAKKPFMLSFVEAYDPLWEARIYKNGKLVEKVRSTPLYSVINGFWINETGNLTIIIRYTPQDWFELGLKISALTFISCIGYLFYDWRREKGDKWVKEIERKVKEWLRRK